MNHLAKLILGMQNRVVENHKRAIATDGTLKPEVSVKLSLDADLIEFASGQDPVFVLIAMLEQLVREMKKQQPQSQPAATVPAPTPPVLGGGP